MPGRRASLAARSAVEAAAGDDPQADFTAEERPERQQYADRRKRRPKPSEAQIAEILRRMGKLSPEDELNCGSCGYATCREKAEAVFFGRAEISMCLPFMKERAGIVFGNDHSGDAQCNHNGIFGKLNRVSDQQGGLRAVRHGQ